MPAECLALEMYVSVFTSPHFHRSPSWVAGTPSQLYWLKMLMGEEEGPRVGPLGALWVSAQLCSDFACCVLLSSHLPLSEISFLNHKLE